MRDLVEAADHRFEALHRRHAPPLHAKVVLVFKAHILVYYSTLDWRVIKKKKKKLHRRHAPPLYRGISRIRNTPPPKGFHRALGIVLL